MIRSLVTRGLQAAIAAALMRAGIAAACPPPPETQVCTEPESGELSACPAIVPDTGLVVTVTGAERETPNDPFVVRVPGAWRNNTWWCDDLALFTIGHVTVGLPPDAAVTPSFTDVRIVKVDRTSMAAYPNYWAVRYGSGAFCLWAADRGYDRTYDVTVQAWDDANDKLYEGVARIQIACVDPSTASFPEGRILSEDSCSATAAQPCFADVPEPPAGTCEAGDGDPGCVPVEGYGCGDTGGGDTGGGDTGGGDTGGGDTGGGDTGSGGSECVPVEGYGCGTAEDGTASGAGGASGSSGSTDSGSGTSGSEGTSEAASSAAPRSGGCSAFPFADPSLGALILLGLGLLRRRRSN